MDNESIIELFRKRDEQAFTEILPNAESIVPASSSEESKEDANATNSDRSNSTKSTDQKDHPDTKETSSESSNSTKPKLVCKGMGKIQS